MIWVLKLCQIRKPLAPLQYCRFIRPRLYTISRKLQLNRDPTNYNFVSDIREQEKNEAQSQSISSYFMFRYSIRSEVTRKYYERRLRKFFDFVGFEIEINVFVPKQWIGKKVRVTLMEKES